MRRFADSFGGDLLDVSRRDVESWIRELQAVGRAKATIRSRWIALRNFYGWLVEEDELDVSPLAKVRVPKPDPPPPDVLGDDELRALLRACEGRSFEDRRDAAIVRFMLATGLRVSETCSLDLADIELAMRLATVRSGKGDKARIVRFDPATAKHIDRYLRARHRHRYARLPAGMATAAATAPRWARYRAPGQELIGCRRQRSLCRIPSPETPVTAGWLGEGASCGCRRLWSPPATGRGAARGLRGSAADWPRVRVLTPSLGRRSCAGTGAAPKPAVRVVHGGAADVVQRPPPGVPPHRGRHFAPRRGRHLGRAAPSGAVTRPRQECDGARSQPAGRDSFRRTVGSAATEQRRVNRPLPV